MFLGQPEPEAFSAFLDYFGFTRNTSSQSLTAIRDDKELAKIGQAFPTNDYFLNLAKPRQKTDTFLGFKEYNIDRMCGPLS